MGNPLLLLLLLAGGCNKLFENNGPASPLDAEPSNVPDTAAGDGFSIEDAPPSTPDTASSDGFWHDVTRWKDSVEPVDTPSRDEEVPSDDGETTDPELPDVAEPPIDSPEIIDTPETTDDSADTAQDSEDTTPDIPPIDSNTICNITAGIFAVSTPALTADALRTKLFTYVSDSDPSDTTNIPTDLSLPVTLEAESSTDETSSSLFAKLCDLQNSAPNAVWACFEGTTASCTDDNDCLDIAAIDHLEFDHILEVDPPLMTYHWRIHAGEAVLGGIKARYVHFPQEGIVISALLCTSNESCDPFSVDADVCGYNETINCLAPSFQCNE